MAETVKNKVTFGLEHCYYSVITENADGSLTFATPKRMKNATEFSASIIGGKLDVHADNQVIVTLSNYSGQDLTFSATEIGDDFKEDILGYVRAASGELVEVTNAPTKKFALGIQIQGDSKARRVWYYNVSTTPFAESSKTTTDSIEVNAPQLAMTAKPVEVGDKKVLRGIVYQGESKYDTFLSTSPVLPTFSN